jgi:transcriptional regulator with XRE-family HTH domain
VRKSRETEDHQRLSELLRRLRRQAGLTQRDLADRLGVRQEWVSRYEVGERRLDVIELARVAHALGTTAIEIIERLGLDQPSKDR